MRVALLPLFLAAFFSFAPMTAEAAFFGPIVPEECNCEVSQASGVTIPSAPDWGCILQIIQNVMNFAVSISTILILLAIVAAGALFMTSATNPGAREQGRQMITNAVLGFLVMLVAWVVVDFIMRTLYDGDKSFGPWNEILVSGGEDRCFEPSEAPEPLAGPPPITPRPGTGSTGATGAGPAGRCSIPTSGNCAPSNLGAFGNSTAARQASQICNAESRGIIRAVSESDVMRNDPQRRAFSYGLFQINLTYHEVGGYNCPDAFNGRNYNATVRNETLFRNCVQAAQTAQHNIGEAVATYNRTRWSEWSTARPCGLAYDGSAIAFTPASSCSTGGVPLTI